MRLSTLQMYRTRSSVRFVQLAIARVERKRRPSTSAVFFRNQSMMASVSLQRRHFSRTSWTSQTVRPAPAPPVIPITMLWITVVESKGGAQWQGERESARAQLRDDLPTVKVLKDSQSVPIRRARERDLGPQPVVDHDDAVEEASPEDNAVRAPRVREVDADERPEPLKVEPRDDDKAGVDRDRVVAGRGEDLDGVDDGKAKALGERGVDAVVARPGVDEGAGGRGLERGLAMAREKYDVDVEARAVAKERVAVRETAPVLERRANDRHRGRLARE